MAYLNGFSLIRGGPIRVRIPDKDVPQADNGVNGVSQDGLQNKPATVQDVTGKVNGDEFQGGTSFQERLSELLRGG